jgi:hypothetical protein
LSRLINIRACFGLMISFGLVGSMPFDSGLPGN